MAMSAVSEQHKEIQAMRFRSKATTMVAGATAAYLAIGAIAAVHAQQTSKPQVQPTSLKTNSVQDPPNLGDFVVDKTAAVALGKALFWEMQASSDNSTACASCHFHAGADNRVKNQLSPGGGGVFDPVPSPNKGGPNYTLTAADFPFHQLSNVNDRDSNVVFDSDDVVGSAGVFPSDYAKTMGVLEQPTLASDATFSVNGIQTRRVTGRNAPTVINAALNFRNFWDGRANFVFNGVSPFGPRDKSAQIWCDDWYTDNTGASVERAVKAYVRIPFASAASQAVGPALSKFEMSSASRVFSDLGHKLISSRPLLYQTVSATDGVLGKYRYAYGFGLNIGYEQMIKAAFQPDFWNVPDATFKASSGLPYRQIEANFSLFWGLAIQLYESTLISNDSRFDQYANGDTTKLTAQEQLGLAIFTSDKGKCVNCHKGAEFTGASSRMVLGSQADGFGGDGPIENMLMGDQTSAIYDNGFYNIGVAPTSNDVGIGGFDGLIELPDLPNGNPLSFSRSFKGLLGGKSAPDSYSMNLDPCVWMVVEGCSIVRSPGIRDAVDGSFKTPTLRNVELTGPYFHNGSYATLEQVVDFYNRGGNVRRTSNGDTSAYGSNTSNFAAEVMPLGLSDAEKAALVAFLKTLTDDRVRYERAPFDHPSLKVTNGHKGDNVTVQSTDGVKALDDTLSLPAVGAAGLSTPIKPFLQQ
jgi:cytochrome c peroxidase